MTLETWGLFIAAVLLLMSTPGPSQLVMLSNSMSHGFPRSLATAFGDVSANFFQMLAAGLGLAGLIAASGHALTIVKWAGVAYLVWIGWTKIMTRPSVSIFSRNGQQRASLKTLWLQGFVTSAVNPRAIVFFAALFPQFIDPSAPFWPQFFILSTTYIGIDLMVLSAYGASAGWLARRLTGSLRNWIDRVGGACLIAAAVALGLRDMPERR